MDWLCGVVEMQGRETPACPTAIHMAAKAAASQMIPTSRNPGAMNQPAIPMICRLPILDARLDA